MSSANKLLLEQTLCGRLWRSRAMMACTYNEIVANWPSVTAVIGLCAFASLPTCERANQKARTVNDSTRLATGSRVEGVLKIGYSLKVPLQSHYRRCRLIAYDFLVLLIIYMEHTPLLTPIELNIEKSKGLFRIQKV